MSTKSASTQILRPGNFVTTSTTWVEVPGSNYIFRKPVSNAALISYTFTFLSTGVMGFYCNLGINTGQMIPYTNGFSAITSLGVPDTRTITYKLNNYTSDEVRISLFIKLQSGILLISGDNPGLIIAFEEH